LLELFGHGNSPSPEKLSSYHPENYANAIEKIRTNLGAESLYLLGYSLGARITLEYALSHPDRVIAHVVTNSLSGFSTPEWIEATRKIMGGILQDVLKRGRPAIEAMPIHPKNSARLNEEMRIGLCRDLAMSDPVGIARTATATALAPPLTNRLLSNQVPTLLTCGRLEKRFQARRDWAEKHMPNLSVVDLNAAHAVNIEAAEEWNAVVLDFLGKHGNHHNQPIAPA
jgi:2-succinyl-6-hydroxy-2,4-cyclohexadiene-1-carboxylate synthase